MWNTYLNLGGDSGIIKYRINSESIDVMFKNGDVYTYPEYIIGKHNLENLISLAKQGSGLHSYIMRNSEVKNGFIR